MGERRIPLPVLGEVSRRTAMKGVGATLGAAAFAVAISPLRRLAEEVSAEEFVQKHYKELSADEKREVLERLEVAAAEEYGAEVTIRDHRPLPGTRFVYAINLSLCNGNGNCVEACHRENNHDRDTNQSYIRVLELPKGSLGLEGGDSTYRHPVPAEDKFYMPVQCQQCDEPPCVDVCPVEATWKEDDGIVVVDYNWCIGCRFCLAACPYFARRFNWTTPTYHAGGINPDMHYIGNRPRFKGTMEKCTFCIQRSRTGRYPACVESCPVGARKFGNLLDPESEIRKLIATKRVFRLKEELGTHPKFFYFID
jgi:molybdopterin-containing oxidoreductase family iron-sulfur binding subunit